MQGLNYIKCRCRVILLPEEAIEISNVWVDDDHEHQSYGNNDGVLNPGEFVEIFYDVTNTSDVFLEGIYGVPDKDYDPYFHPNDAYWLDDHLGGGINLEPGETTRSDDLDCFIASDTPEGHVITIPIAFFERDNNPIGNDTIRVPATGTDTTPPQFTESWLDPIFTPVGEVVTISVFIKEASTLHDVFADIESPNENILATIALVDDGTHGDEFADDRRFTGQWSPTIEADFWVDFSATDDYSNTGEADNILEFTSMPPPEPSASILLVVDHPNGAFMHYYTDALDANGFGYDIWESNIYGMVTEDYLRHYRNGVVIWYCGHSFPILSEEERNVISYYLNHGGNLFLTDQDVGWDLNENQGDPAAAEWYSAYLYANYVADESGSRYLTGVDGDIISDGLAFSIEGGDGANNQDWPSEISPIEPAVSILCYDGSEAQEKFIAQSIGPKKASRRNFEIIKPIKGKSGKEKWQVIEKFPSPRLSVENENGCRSGAIRVDNGLYKLVYFAFGFEGIADGRADVMERVVRWLQRVHISGAVSYSNTERPVSDTQIELIHIEDVSATTTDESGEYYFGEILRGEVELIPNKDGDQRDAITLSDALMALYYRAGLISLTEEQQLAADVNEDGRILLYDIDDMLRYMAFLPQKYGGKTGEWRFSPQDTIFNAHRNYADVNFTAFLLGDVSQNWGESAATKSVVCDGDLILEQPQKGANNEVRIPVSLNSGSISINTLAFSLEYDSTVLALKSFTPAEMARDFITVVNPNSAGKVHLAMAGLEGLTESGSLFSLNFEVKPGSNVSRTDISFTRSLLNDLPAGSAASMSIDLEGLKLGTPTSFKLANNYPNPFNPETIIEYQLPEQARVTIRIYDILGQEVKTLVDDSRKSGYYRVAWDGRNNSNAQAASGVYIYTLKSDKFNAMKKMVLVR